MGTKSLRMLKEGSEVTGRHFGLDEAGRGPLAGPLVVAAVEYPCAEFEQALRNREIAVADSKRLSPKKRERLCDLIMAHCKVSVIYIDAPYIDKFGMTSAASLAATRAFTDLIGRDGNPPDQIVLDGTPGNWGDLGELYVDRCRFMVNGDKHVPAISAASIVAKHCHDYYMITSAHAAYPMYGFNKHMGYGTEAHMEALEKYGSCELHRHTFRPVRERDGRD